MPKTESSRAESLLRKVNKELGSIPEYDFKPMDLKMGSGRVAGVQAVKNISTALRRGLRKLQGGESKPSLELKRKRVKDLIAETAELKNTGFDLGSKPIEKGKSSYTNQSKADVIAAGNKRRREMK
jgi:hypothetical protein